MADKKLLQIVNDLSKKNCRELSKLKTFKKSSFKFITMDRLAAPIPKAIIQWIKGKEGTILNSGEYEARYYIITQDFFTSTRKLQSYIDSYKEYSVRWFSSGAKTQLDDLLLSHPIFRHTTMKLTLTNMMKDSCNGKKQIKIINMNDFIYMKSIYGTGKEFGSSRLEEFDFDSWLNKSDFSGSSFKRSKSCPSTKRKSFFKMDKKISEEIQQEEKEHQPVLLNTEVALNLDQLVIHPKQADEEEKGDGERNELPLEDSENQIIQGSSEPPKRQQWQSYSQRPIIPVKSKYDWMEKPENSKKRRREEMTQNEDDGDEAPLAVHISKRFHANTQAAQADTSQIELIGQNKRRSE